MEFGNGNRLEQPRARRHTLQRTCIACGLKSDAADLLRVVRTSGGAIAADPNRLLPGRGAHVCKSVSCVTRAIEKRLFNKAFRAEIARKSATVLFAALGEPLPSASTRDVNRATG